MSLSHNNECCVRCDFNQELRCTDIADDAMGRWEIFKSDRAKTEKETEALGRRAKKGWPVIPFTPWHAEEILNFLMNNNFDANIHIQCEYGRSRSVAVAQYISFFLRPNHELIISRADAKMNPRIYRILSKVNGTS